MRPPPLYTQSPYGNLFFVDPPSCSWRLQREHAVHGPSSGVVLARCSERASTTPLGVVFVGGTATA